jgi:hypothetical protein
VEENCLTTSSNVRDSKKMKLVDFSSKLYLEWSIFIKFAFAIEI